MAETQPQTTSSHKNEFASSGSSPTLSGDRFTITEFADMLGFPVAALVAIIEKNRSAIKKPFYNITDLANRWDCSRAHVHKVLREAEYKAFNLASRDSEERCTWRIPASVVERIEQARMERLPEAAA